MLKVFEKNIGKVRARCSVNLLLRYAGQVLIAAGVIAIAAVIIEKLLALGLINVSTLLIFGIVLAAAIFSVWLYKQPSKMQVSLLLDERMQMKERFSTNLKMSDVHDAFSEAARNEAINKAQSLNLKGHFPIKLSKGWAYSGALWLVVIMLFGYMPQKDLLGIINRRDRQLQEEKQKEEAKSQVNKATEHLKLTMNKINDPNIAEALDKLDSLSPNTKPEEVKREAIRKLGDLSEKLKDVQKSKDVASMKLMQQMLKQLKGSQDSFSQQLRSELSKGNYNKAASLLREMQKELQQGKLSEEQQKKLSEQMQELANALEKLAQQSGELEKELEKMGLDKGLAQMGEQQLRDALQKQGLSSEKIEDLVNKAAAASMARDRMSQMANAMASAGGSQGQGQLSGEELSDAIEQLDSLESLQQQMNLTEMSLSQLAQAIGSLGQGMMQGLGGQSPWSPGNPEQFGNGTGNPGMGQGERDTAEGGDYGTKREKEKTKTQKGKIIASWYFKDEQVKGESNLDFTEVIQAGRDSAAEAISENEIPRRYEEAMKIYFNNIQNSVPSSNPNEENE